MTKSQRFFLPDRHDLGHFGNTSKHLDHFWLAAIGEHLLQLGRVIEMIFDAILATAGDEDDLLDTRIHRFLHDVLNRWDIDDRQKFFRYGLCRGEKASSQTRHGYDCFSKLHGFFQYD